MRPKLTAKILYTYVCNGLVKNLLLSSFPKNLVVFLDLFILAKLKRDSRKNKTAPTRKETKPLAPRATVQWRERMLVIWDKLQ